MNPAGRTSFPIAIAASLVLLAVAATAGGTTLRVPGEYPTIQAGISAAGFGDTVLVADGLYTGAGNRNLDFGGVDLVLCSENGAESTVIDAQGSQTQPRRVFFLHSGETNDAAIEGFTIRGGWINAAEGAGIYCNSSSPTIRRCMITTNVVSALFYDGGGVFLRSSSARIEECTIRWNYATYGGGIACRGVSTPAIIRCEISGNAGGYGGGIDGGGTSSPRILDCRIIGNEAFDGFEDPGSGGGLVLGGGAVVEGCTITGNGSGYGAGVACWSGTPRIVGCTIAGNDARQFRGGGLASQSSSVTLERSVVWGNCAATGSGLLAGYGGTITIGCSVYDTATSEDGGQIFDAGTNILGDPLFCLPEICESAPTTEGDYRVSSASPCVPVNNACGVWIGSEPIGCPAASVPDAADLLDPRTILGLPHPNPAREAIGYTIDLPRAAEVRVRLVDVRGRAIATILDLPLEAGFHSFSWSLAEDARGRGLPSGIYLLRLDALGNDEVRRIVVAR